MPTCKQCQLWRLALWHYSPPSLASSLKFSLYVSSWVGDSLPAGMSRTWLEGGCRLSLHSVASFTAISAGTAVPALVLTGS